MFQTNVPFVLRDIMKASGIMSRRVNLIGICTIGISFFVLLFFATKNSNYYDEYSKKENSNPLKYNKYRNYYYASDQPQQVTQNLSVTIEDVLNYERQLIAEEMQYYEYPNGRFGVDAKNLQELTPETGGMPMRSIIISTWRSGSTFLGDILNALPGNFYHYEPLLTYDIMQIRGPPHDRPAIKSLKKLLKCNYTGLDDYLEFGENHNYLFTHNSRLWNQCHLFPSFCYQPKFLEPFCKLFPLQSMKVVRLRMKIAASLLRDTRAVRYEDLSLSPYDITQEILQFYGLAFDDRVSEFLDTHTKTNVGGVSSTFRDSKSAPFHWTKELPYNEVKYIQDSCKEAMRLWGYKEASNASELLRNFNPLLPFPYFDSI
ncbi:CLUMA_CG000999, isoform A [Clunio marinus]|uniref:CLUMA_CG000999, isoform A n=1 Tax=Clunio marinus TaxID=568069 RepID=A0A1J1HI13_9DIPT|nr:CLUMA_CG000999, isoform A [Clunio marinus]